MKPVSKTTSAKQIAANRRNAVKSTGPRTEQGRAVSKMNAFKHGILSKQVLVKALHYRESSHELEALQQRFWDEFQPEGPVEEMLMDRIVTAHWRLRRAQVAESGEIALSVDDGYWKGGRGTDALSQWNEWFSSSDMEEAMQRTRLGNVVLLGWLEDVRRAVEREGALTVAVVQELAQHFHDKPSSLVVELECLCARHEANAGGADAVARREENNAEARALIDQRICEIRSIRDRCAEHEDSIDEAHKAAAVLPSAATLDRILRYETKLERQLYRAMAQLERLQRMRRGETIPAPLSVEVSGMGVNERCVFCQTNPFLRRAERLAIRLNPSESNPIQPNQTNANKTR